MVTLAMATHEEDLVLLVLVGVSIQRVHVVVESLPRSLLPFRIEVVVSRVCTIDQPIVGLSLRFGMISRPSTLFFIRVDEHNQMWKHLLLDHLAGRNR
jgi:hypothetical protein